MQVRRTDTARTPCLQRVSRLETIDCLFARDSDLLFKTVPDFFQCIFQRKRIFLIQYSLTAAVRRDKNGNAERIMDPCEFCDVVFCDECHILKINACVRNEFILTNTSRKHSGFFFKALIDLAFQPFPVIRMCDALQCFRALQEILAIQMCNSIFCDDIMYVCPCCHDACALFEEWDNPGHALSP